MDAAEGERDLHHAGQDEAATEEESSCSDPSLMRLRKRKLNLNELSHNLGRPLVCQYQFCGVRLKDGESLDWHYQGHLARELERLDKGVRVKKNPKDFPDRTTRSRVRRAACERIRFRREAREALPPAARMPAVTDGGEQPRQDLRCPVCSESLGADGSVEGLSEHVEACLRVAPPPEDIADDGPDTTTGEGSDVLVDVDGREGFEEYEWAGQRRVRATSLVEGGLRGSHGFLTIERGDEDEELDIEGVEREEDFGRCQYDDRDVVTLPGDAGGDGDRDEEEDEESRERLRAAVAEGAGRKNRRGRRETEREELLEKDLENATAEEKLSALREENDRLRRSSRCNVCMDSYRRPVVSTACWHVLCEECWLRSLGAKKLCPQCKVITRPQDLRKIYL